MHCTLISHSRWQIIVVLHAGCAKECIEGYAVVTVETASYLHVRTSLRHWCIPRMIGEHSMPAEAATKTWSVRQHWQPPRHLQYNLHWAQKARWARQQPSSLPASLPGRARPALWRNGHVTMTLLQAEEPTGSAKSLGYHLRRAASAFSGPGAWAEAPGAKLPAASGDVL